MRRLESSTEQRVVKWAERHGILHTKLNIAGRRGWPDRVFWLSPARPVFFEFKRAGAEPTALQRYTMHQLKLKGYDVNWTDNTETAIRYLAQRAGIRYP